MAEGQDLGAVDVGRRPDGGNVEIAAEQLDAHGVPFPEGRLSGASDGPGLTGGPGPDRQESERGEERTAFSKAPAENPLMTSGSSRGQGSGSTEGRPGAAVSVFKGAPESSS